MVSEFDKIIVRAGPVGNTAAYFLSLAGKRVLVLEKERLPRYKACGGALSPKVLKQFHFSFDPVIEHRVSQASFAFGNNFATTPIAAGDITSGRLAAEAILAEKPEQYARQVDKKIRGSHLWAWRLAAFFYRFQGLCFRAGMTNPQAVPAFLELLAGESSYRRVMLKLLASLPMQLARHLLGNPTQVLISARGV